MKSQAIVSFLAGATVATLVVAVRELTATLEETSAELRRTLDSLHACRAQFKQATRIVEFPGRETQLLGGWLNLSPRAKSLHLPPPPTAPPEKRGVGVSRM